jgi:hypothetical protein
MAESFNNALTSSVGIETSNTNGTVGVTTNLITGISTVGVAVSDLIVNQHFRGNAKVISIGASEVRANMDSTNTASAATQFVQFLGVTTAFTSNQKSILVGGTFANLTNNNVNLFVEVGQGNTMTAIGNDIPVPTGSSFVISDAGKTVLTPSDEIRVYCDTSNALDITLSILEGIS